MRIISGTAGGRKLITPEGMDVRPTTDNVKESVFNIIQFEIEGRRVLDLFAGSGQLGIECISRGAEHVTFVDNDRKSVDAVKKNLKTCGMSADVFLTDAVSFLKDCPKYDIIFIDPPYDSDLYEKVLENIYLFDILNVGGIIVCESRKEKKIHDPIGEYCIKKTYSYGRIKITLITR